MKPFALCLALLLSLTTSTFAANLLVNPGFEDPITQDGPPFIGFWEAFNSTGSTAVNSTLLPRTGAQSLQLSINNTINTFAGAFQDVGGLAPGMSFSLGGWHATTSSPLSLGVEVRIEWRNSISNTEISRTPNATPIPGATYAQFGFDGLVPAGADTARIVYAIQSFSTNPLGNGTVYVDDMSFTVVPEPSSIALLSVGGLALLGFRRRQSLKRAN
jgi:hypothetical protein